MAYFSIVSSFLLSIEVFFQIICDSEDFIVCEECHNVLEICE